MKVFISWSGKKSQEIALNREPIINRENWNFTKSGKKICLLTNGVPVIDEKDNLLGYRGVDKDINNQKKTEQRLKESEEKYRSLFENSPTGIALHQRGKVVNVNSTGLKILGYDSVDEVIGKPVTDIVHPDFIETARKNIAKMVKNPGTIETLIDQILLRRDGSTVRVTTVSQSINYEGEIAIQVSFIDNTDQKRIEEQSQKRYRRIEGLNAASQSLVSTLNFEKVVERCTILAKELIGTDGAILFLLDEEMTHLKPIVAKGPGSKEALAVTLKLGEGVTGQVAKSGQSEIVNRVDLTGRGKQVPGTPVEPESLLCSPLKMKDKTIGVMTLSRLGETGFSEEDLDFLENLANISASAIGNARLFEETKKADKTKSWFLANISHEIRNPLNVMVGYTDMLRDILEGKLNQKEKAHLKTIEQNAYRLMRIVNRILEYSQLETGTIKLSPRLLNLNLFIKSLIREYKPEAEEKGLQLYFESVVKNAEVMIDEISISHALSNIIDNAIKYTEKGEIRIKLVRPDKYLILSIEDTGVGISKEFITRLCDPFSQESEGYSRKKYEGTGIGMAIVKRHLDLNNVALEINSEKGKGTTVTLTFKR